MMDSARKRIETNFTHHPPKEGQPAKYIELRDTAKALCSLMHELCPPSGELNQAEDRLQESVFWANAAIARYGK